MHATAALVVLGGAAAALSAAPLAAAQTCPSTGAHYTEAIIQIGQCRQSSADLDGRINCMQSNGFCAEGAKLMAYSNCTAMTYGESVALLNGLQCSTLVREARDQFECDVPLANEIGSYCGSCPPVTPTGITPLLIFASCGQETVPQNRFECMQESLLPGTQTKGRYCDADSPLIQYRGCDLLLKNIMMDAMGITCRDVLGSQGAWCDEQLGYIIQEVCNEYKHLECGDKYDPEAMDCDIVARTDPTTTVDPVVVGVAAGIAAVVVGVVFYMVWSRGQKADLERRQLMRENSGWAGQSWKGENPSSNSGPAMAPMGSLHKNGLFRRQHERSTGLLWLTAARHGACTAAQHDA